MLDDLTTLPVPPTDDPLLDTDDESAVPSVEPLPDSLEELAAVEEAVDPDADAADVV